MRAKRITDRVVMVGGPGLSDGQDCLVYAVDLGDLVLIDCGAGPGWYRIRERLVEAGLDPAAVHTLILTHCHIDHVGAAAQAVAETGCRVVAHELDAEAIETGDPVRTAASWYGLDLPPLRVDHRVRGDGETLAFAAGSIELVHAPGHTPGSMAALISEGGKKVLFGQDVHGPFSPEFGSDVAAWRRSMARLIALEADVLCEGHYGVFEPAAEVRRFIEGQLLGR
jgi:metallo-beta-lactamase class B